MTTTELKQNLLEILLSSFELNNSNRSEESHSIYKKVDYETKYRTQTKILTNLALYSKQGLMVSEGNLKS